MTIDSGLDCEGERKQWYETRNWAAIVNAGKLPGQDSLYDEARTRLIQGCYVSEYMGYPKTVALAVHLGATDLLAPSVKEWHKRHPMTKERAKQIAESILNKLLTQQQSRACPEGLDGL